MLRSGGGAASPSFVRRDESLAQTLQARRRLGQLMLLRNANNNMKSVFVWGGRAGGCRARSARVTLKWLLSAAVQQGGMGGGDAGPQLNRCFDCVQDNEVLLCPTGCESQAALSKPLDMRAPGAAGGTLGRVRPGGWRAPLCQAPRGRGGGAQKHRRTVAAALRIERSCGGIEAEQQKWVSLQAAGGPGQIHPPEVDAPPPPPPPLPKT